MRYPSKKKFVRPLSVMPIDFLLGISVIVIVDVDPNNGVFVARLSLASSNKCLVNTNTKMSTRALSIYIHKNANYYCLEKNLFNNFLCHDNKYNDKDMQHLTKIIFTGKLYRRNI